MEFRRVKDDFQEKLRADIRKINSSPNVFVFADKTSNLYEMKPDEYKKILKENITKTYSKAPKKLETAINSEAKQISNKLGLSDRMEKLAKNQAFVTLKDHKENFNSKPTCRLINPCKSEVGKVSKHIIDKINQELRNNLQLNQWKNTQDVIQWFNNIHNKELCAFIQLDIKDFYPSITEKLLKKAISFAKQQVPISQQDIRIIHHCRKSLLFNEEEAWKKKENASCFDVTMGSFDGAEVCEMIGLYILSLLNKHLNKGDIGLYRDDGLVVLKNYNGQQTEKAKQFIIKTFKNVGFKIEIETKLKEVNFLDVTLNLVSGKHRPYKKPNDKLQYIHKSSNHPPQVLKQLPQSINDRLSNNSSNKEVFDGVKKEYESALKESGFTTNLKYEKRKRKSRNRKRKTIWFNPPYNKNVKTSIAQKFLRLLDKHFPRGNKLHKIFNRNNVKVSYGCTNNMSQIIKSHNNKMLCEKKKQTARCSCRNKNQCPLNGNCEIESVMYNCDVQTESTPKKTYIGITEGSWKARHRTHKHSFINEQRKNYTDFSRQANVIFICSRAIDMLKLILLHIPEV